MLETYGSVHLSGVWIQNGHGGSSGVALSLSFPHSSFITVFQTQTLNLKEYFTAWYQSLRLQIFITRMCSEESKDLAGQLKSSFSLSFPFLYSMLACFLVPVCEVINLSFAVEVGHLVRVPCAVAILPLPLSQCHTGNDTVWGME